MYVVVALGMVCTCVVGSVCCYSTGYGILTSRGYF